MPPMSGIAESLNAEPDPSVTPPAPIDAADQPSFDEGPSQTG